jgi:hypothetical protein
MADRCLIIREVQNVVGKVVHCDMLSDYDLVYPKFWSQAEDVCLGFNDGYFQGAAAVKHYYEQKLDNAKKLTKLVMAHWGDHPKVQGKTEAEMFGAGYVKGTDLHTPIIEVAEDMQSAKALWQFQAADTRVTTRGPLSVWKIGYMAADLVLENGEWRVKNLLYAVDIDHPCAEPWTETSKYPEIPEFAAFDIPEPVPNVPAEVYTAYTVDRPYQQPPRMPEPYTTLAETFSYGL